MQPRCGQPTWPISPPRYAASNPTSIAFHIDAADGSYAGLFLFFPDLVAALRPHTRLPFEVHLIMRNPLAWVDPFIDAGADSIIFYLDAAPDPAAVIATVRSRGRQVGISLRIEDPVELLEPYWTEDRPGDDLGTEPGVKGVGMDPTTPARIRQARGIVAARGLPVEIEADGGIRRTTVPLLVAAGVDVIVPGSLLFQEDPAAVHAWLAGLS